MRWGVLGIGRVTPRMVKAFRLAGHTVEGAAARNTAALHDWGREHGVTRLTQDFHSLCRDDAIDAIYVALPPHLHFEYASYAMEHGKRVLCEKPLTMNGEQSQNLLSSSRSTGSPLFHATAFPCHPRSQAMRDVVRSGEIGEVKRVSVACSFSHVLQRGRDHRTSADAGGGCLLDLGWYCVFATMWFTGLSPTQIQGMGTRLRTTEGHEGSSSESNSIWSSVQGLARLDNGAVAHWDCGFDATGRKWIEIAGTEGSIVCDDFLRPWNENRPRFWVHGSEGKGREVLVGAGVNQEVEMVLATEESLERSGEVTSMGTDQNAASSSMLEQGVATQQFLDQWEQATHLGTLS